MPRPPSATRICRQAHDLAASHGAILSDNGPSVSAMLSEGRRWIFSRDRALTIERRSGETVGDVWQVLVKAMGLGTYDG